MIFEKIIDQTVFVRYRDLIVIKFDRDKYSLMLYEFDQSKNRHFVNVIAFPVEKFTSIFNLNTAYSR